LVNAQPAATTTAVRALWVQPLEPEGLRAAQIRNKLVEVGWLVYLTVFHPALDEACRAFDLIILDGSAQTVEAVANAVRCIRVGNRAPIVVLTNQDLLAWSLAILPAGADAVLALNTPIEIVVMRCVALLRRWLRMGLDRVTG
jgi:DNA-binding response OmpR family regulator